MGDPAVLNLQLERAGHLRLIVLALFFGENHSEGSGWISSDTGENTCYGGLQWQKALEEEHREGNRK